MDDQFRLYHIAKLYYVENMKQAEIADMMHMSVMAVSRLLRAAEENGIVSVQVRAPQELDHSLSVRLRQKYPGLSESLVLSERGSANPVYTLASVAADYVLDLLADGSSMGISWGRAISEFAAHLRPCEAKNVTVIQLSGSFLCENNYLMMPSNIVQTASDKLRCSALYLNMPMFIYSQEVRRQLMTDSLNRYTLDKAHQNLVNVVGLSALSDSPTMLKVGAISEQDQQELLAAGAVGDVYGYFIDAEGKPVKWSKQDLYGGVDLDVIAGAKHVVCLATGAGKAKIAHLALRERYINTLIVTSELAQAILEE